MKELINLSTHDDEFGVFGSDWERVKEFLTRHQLDGIELYVDQKTTQHDIPKHLVQGAHLPYWMGRHRAWMDDSVFSSATEADEKLYLYGGLSRDEIITNFRKAMENAQSLDAAYGVFHVAYVELEHVLSRSFNCTDRDVMKTTADFLNAAVLSYPDNEPPIRLLFENLWWPGLTFLHPDDLTYFIDMLDFDNWGFMLDTGHLMAAITHCYTEDRAIDAVLDVLSKYKDDVIDRIEGIHFHCSLSGGYIRKPNSEILEGFEHMSFSERLDTVMPLVENIDQHMPFTHERCSEIVDYISPDYLTHEFILHDLPSTELKVKTQRSALNKRV